MATTLHLRSESKALEHRSALTPTTAKALIAAGIDVNVERSPVRVFNDLDFEAVGARLVPGGSWVDAPPNHIIIGLKELPEQSFPLKHTHIQFAHCFKNQHGWQKVLSRFAQGGGVLLDLEFLTDEFGRRVAAFGYHAGYAGAALAIMSWAWQLCHPPSTPFPGVEAYPQQHLLLDDVRSSMKEGTSKTGSAPRVLIIGALGRCGSGAVDLCRQAGVPEENIIKWDMAETAIGGPFTEIIESDIFVNCIYLSSPLPPFLDTDFLASPIRKLRTVCDVSCDTTNPHNPIPIYTENSTFSAPTLPVNIPSDPPLRVISIDHLPTLLPRESSESFSDALYPYLLQLRDRTNSKVWRQAEQLYRDIILTLPEPLRMKEEAVLDVHSRG